MKKSSMYGEDLTPTHEFVKYWIEINAITFGGRELKNGRVSPYFFDSGVFNTGKTMSNLTQAYVALISRFFKPDIIFGSAYGGIPIAATVVQSIGGNTGYAFNCENGKIIGASVKGKNVLIVDDAITSSSAKTVNVVRVNGGIPIGYVVAFDHQERTSEGIMSEIQWFQKKFGISVLAVATLDDVILFLRKIYIDNGDDWAGRILNKILAYRGQYGMI